MASKRGITIQGLYDTEILARQLQTEKYLSELEKYIGEEVAYIEMNSRYTPDSGYFNDYK